MAMRVLFAGLGSIGQRHLRNLRSLVPDVEVDAFRARRHATVVTEHLGVAPGENVERSLGVRAFTDLDEAIAQRPDVVFVCNPSSMHLHVARQAARAGAHIFLEKPVSDRLEGLDQLIELVESRKLVVAVGCQLRFHPCLRRLRALLAEGAIGRLAAVRVHVGEYLPSWHPYEDYRKSYAARSDLGGGVVLTLIHELDYVYWLFGLPRQLFAVGGQLSRLEMDVEDTASILMEYWVDERPLPVHVQMDYLQRPPSRGCEVVGDAGRLVLDLREPSLIWYAEDGSERECFRPELFERNQLFVGELTNFLECVRGVASPAVSLREGADVVRLALATKESMTTNRVVPVA
jgi:predicted dehydrogenase